MIYLSLYFVNLFLSYFYYLALFELILTTISLLLINIINELYNFNLISFFVSLFKFIFNKVLYLIRTFLLFLLILMILI